MVYVPANEARIKAELLEPPFDDPQFEIVRTNHLGYEGLNQSKVVNTDYLDQSCERRFRENYSRLRRFYTLFIKEEAFFLAYLENQENNPFSRLRFALERLTSDLGLSESSREQYDQFKLQQDNYNSTKKDFHSYIVENDCLSPTYTLNLSSTTDNGLSQSLTIDNENPYGLPPELAQVHETPIFLDVYGAPNWLEVTPKQKWLPIGESETLEFTATCPSSNHPATYEGEVGIFQPPAFVDMVEVRLECPATSS